jgi:Ca2+-binding RTX toxin-like protein
MATFKGGTGNDTLKGGSAADTLWGLAGNDSLFGFGGNDVLDGGTGSDTMRGGAGNDTYFINSTGDKIDEQGNTDSSDKVRSTISVNLTKLGAGAIEHATLLGTGNINATGNTKNNSLTGNTGNNSLSGGDGNDTLNGGLGNDKLAGGNGNDRMLGGAGNDTITGGAGNDRIDGGAGNDTIRHSGTGTDGDDVLIPFSGGIDTIVFTGKDFYDINWDWDGSDLILATAADENYEFDGTVRVVGFLQSETSITVKIDTQFNLDYGTNANLATFHFNANITKGLNNTNDTELLFGTAYTDDVINGNGGFYDGLFGLDGNDTLNGGAGLDVIRGGRDDDVLNGGTGDDTLRGDSGTDTYNGGDGVDQLRFRGGDEEDHGAIVDLSTGTVIDDGFGNTETFTSIENVRGSSHGDDFTGDGNDNIMRGEEGNDTLTGAGGSDNLLGGVDDDTLSGGDDNDNLFGDAGEDTINGDAGDDFVDAGDDDDTVDGGAGNDFLAGGAGADTMTGGTGSDGFELSDPNAVDEITDFSVADDNLFFFNLIDPATTAADLSDFLTFDDSGADTLVLFDEDGTGSGTAVQLATLNGVGSANGLLVFIDQGIAATYDSTTGEFA